jgi:tetratricopeptide (TPR) repeat protein
LIVLTSIAYLGLNEHSFINYDDNVYVTTNSRVQTGLSWKNVAWAFTTTSAANWHPLTWLSHMLDCELFGLNPAGHHLTSLFVHTANVVMLFWLLQLMTGALWQSALVAALFAVHPINVESVAWVAERKNVLSTLLWLVTTCAYVWYARKPAWGRYLVVCVSFAGAIMCKPMVVTLPFTLLLLDYWPLGRLKQAASEAEVEKPGLPNRRSRQTEAKRSYPMRSMSQLLLEKLPLLLLVAGSSLITLKAQKSGGAVGSLETFPLLIRLENALVSYATYLRDVIWPFQLAVFYPHPGHLLPAWQVVVSSLMLAAISALAIALAKGSRYLPAGWFWYLGTLIPVIGIVQVGLQSHADRYAYIPLIGIFIIAVWSAFDWAKGRRLRVTLLAVSSAAVLIALTVITRIQSSYWQNGITLFQHALSVTEKNYVADNDLGELFAQQGRLDEAARHFASALEINPRFAQARHNMGMMLVQRGKLDEAIDEFSKAVEIDPRFADAYNKLGAALASKGRLDEAAANFSKALEVDPAYAPAHANLGSLQEQQGKIDEAIASYSNALKFMADNTMSAQTHFRLGKLLARTGKRSEAIEHYRESLTLKPDYAPAQQALKGIPTETNQSSPNR